MRTLLLALVAFATVADAQDRAIAAGVSMPAGYLAVEYVRHPVGEPVGVAAGVGVAGVGGRVQVRLREQSTDYGFNSRYLSAGVLVSPWRFSTFDTPAALAVEYGAEFVGPLYISMAGGGMVPLGGTINGHHLLPSIRFVVGAAI